MIDGYDGCNTISGEFDVSLDNGSDNAYGVDNFGDGELGVKAKIFLGSTTEYRSAVLLSSKEKMGP